MFRSVCFGIDHTEYVYQRLSMFSNSKQQVSTINAVVNNVTKKDGKLYSTSFAAAVIETNGDFLLFKL